MLNQFSSTELLYGKVAMDRLSKSRIAIFGIGVVGGYVYQRFNKRSKVNGGKLFMEITIRELMKLDTGR